MMSRTKDPSRNSRISIPEIKAAARGHWNDLLQDAGLPADCLSERGRSCPKCGGDDRYNAAKEVNETGAVFCRQCFGDKSARIKPGDGIATVAWLMDTSTRDALCWLAERLGLNRDDGDKARLAEELDIITAVCRDKRMPVDSFKEFGVNEEKRGRDKFPVARVDVYNEAGVVHSYFDLWPGRKGKFKYSKGSAGMFFPGRLPVAGETWLLVEGVKDAAALVGLGFHAAGMPTNKLANKYARLFSGVDIIIVPDLDLSGVKGSEHTAGHLFGIAASVAVARLPGQVKEKQGDDVRNVLRLPDGEHLVREAVNAATKWEPCGDDNPIDERPEVIVTMDEAAVADQVVRYLGRLGWDSSWIKQRYRNGVRVYVRGGLLVHAIESDDLDSDGRLTIRALPSCLVRERITQSCRLLVEKETEDEIEVNPVRPPNWLNEAVFRRGHYGGAIRPLSGIIESPTIRSDGSIIQTPGYDSRTGLIYRPTAVFPTVPQSPTRDDAAKALSDLSEVLTDFPMIDRADETAWVAMVLSMIGRSCIDGCVPLFAVTANIRGAGKSLLVDAASLIAYGHRAGRQAFTRDDNEMRKVITAVALAATPSVLFDNLDVQLGGAALDAAITSSVWSDRVLGQSRMTGDLPIRTLWSATGNNLAFGSDIGRRVLPIRLQSPLETPEDRSEFQHPDLLGWIESERPRLAVAALTILRAYFVAGCPTQSGGVWGSFENFSAVIRGAIIWAGGRDPLLTRETVLASDDTVGLLGKLIEGIEQADPSGEGLTTKKIGEITFGREAKSPSHDVLFEAAAEICGHSFNGRKFGRRIRRLLGRVWQGRFIDAQPAGGNVNRWRVRSVESGFGGFSGAVLSSSDTKQKCSPDELLGLDRDDSEAKSVPQRGNPSNQPNQPESQAAKDWGEL